MDHSKTTIEELKAMLDEAGVDYSDAKKKDDYIGLLPSQDETVAEPTEVPASLSESLASMANNSKAEEKPSEPSHADVLRNRDPGKLTLSQKILLDNEAIEYVSVEGGKAIRINPRYTGSHVSEMASEERYDFKSSKVYIVSNADYEALMTKRMPLKTEATRGLCCGRAKYESGPVFVDVEV